MPNASMKQTPAKDEHEKGRTRYNLSSMDIFRPQHSEISHLVYQWQSERIMSTKNKIINGMSFFLFHFFSSNNMIVRTKLSSEHEFYNSFSKS